MDIIDKIFNKLQKEKAPHGLRAQILDIPSAKPAKVGFGIFSTMFKFAVPALIIVLLAGGFFYAQYWRVPQAHASFELTAEQTTKDGIETTSSFILTSSSKLTTYQIKQIVKFSPEVEFSVDSIGDKRYRITPKGNLGENQIYNVSIEEGPADHDYSWAYQIKANFQVISTLPGNRGTDVPVATGIEINLNREGVLAPEKSFEISPNVSGTFEQHGTTLLFRPAKPLQAGTVYTVTLKKGLAIKDSPDTLANDYVFMFETERPQNYSNLVSFSSDFYDVIQTRPVVPVYASDNAKAKGVLYKFNKPESFISSYAESDNWRYSWSYLNNARTPKNLNEQAAQKILEYDVAFQKNGNSQYIEIPQDLSDGYYLLDVISDNYHNYVWLQKTPVAHYTSYSYERSLVWLYDFAKKQPLKDVSVQLTNGSVIGSTDGEGLSQFDTPQEFKDNNKPLGHGYYETKPNVAVVKSAGYNPYYIVQTSNYYTTLQEGSRYWEHLSVDRPLYQLTDSMQFWGIVRPRDNKKAPEKVKISLYRGYVYSMFGGSIKTGEPITTMEVPVSDFSTYEGKLDFSGLTADTYTLVASEGDYIISNTSVQVTTFSKPAYQLSLDTDKKAYNTDENITFHVAAKFYDQTPLDNLVLDYTGSNGAIGQVTTDKNGLATINVTKAYVPDSASQPAYWPDSLYLSVAPHNSEEAFIQASKSVVIVGPKVSLETEVNPKQDGTNTFTVTARNISTDLFETNEPSYYQDQYQKASVLPNQEVKVEVKKTTYTTRQTGEYYDFIEKVTRPTYAYDKTEAIVESFSGVTDKSGAWRFDKKYNYEPNVYYSLAFESADKQNKIARSSSSYVFSQNPYFYTDSSYNPNGLQPQLEYANKNNNSVNVGDNMQFNLQFNNAALAATSKPTKILYYAYQRNILKATTSDSLTHVDTFAQGMSPMVSYKAVVLGPIGFEESNPATVALNTETVKLKIEVNTDKEDYRPGDTVNASIKVTDSNGKAGSGTVYMSVVDEAIFDVVEYSEQVDTVADLYKYVVESPAVSLTQYNSPGNDGGGGGGGPSTPRAKFQDTVVAKSIDLSGNGEAKLSFKLPDNLTSWRLTTQAFDPKAIKAGSAVKNISTGLPLFADLSMSSVYVKGDSPEFRVRVFGKKYDENKPAHITVTAPSLSLNFDQDVKGGVAYVPAGSLSVGQFPLEVKVKQGEFEDSLIRTVNVIDSSLTVPKVSNYKLSDGLKDISGSQNGLTQLIVTDAGKGKQFDLLSQLAWQSGARFDQRASSYYAQKVLHDEFGLPGEPEKFDPAIFQTKLNEGQGDIRLKTGLSLFSYGDPELRTSALGAALIPDTLPKESLITYFNNSLRDTKADTHRVTQSLYGLAAYKQPVLTKLQLIKDDPSLDMEDTLFVANGLAVLGDKETARKLYFDNIKPKLVSDNGQLYLADKDETRQAKLTALAGMLASQLNISSDRDQMVIYLKDHAPKKDLISLEEALIVKYALAQSAKETASFSYKTSKRSGSFELKDGNRFNLDLLTDELKSLEFSNVKGDIQLLSWYNGASDGSTKPNLNIPIKRDYSVLGKSTTNFKDGDLVKVVLTADAKAGVGRNQVYQITDILPAGLRPITPSYFNSDWGYSPCNQSYTYPDTIDGNKISFTINQIDPAPNCKVDKVMRVEYYARVSGFGEFKADQPILTSLEDPTQFNLGEAKTIKITK